MSKIRHGRRRGRRYRYHAKAFVPNSGGTKYMVEREERAREKAVQEEVAMRCIEISQTKRHTERRDCCAKTAAECAAACRKPIKVAWYVVVLGKTAGRPMYFVESADTSKGEARMALGTNRSVAYKNSTDAMSSAFVLSVKYPEFLGRVAVLRKTQRGEVVMTPDFREI